MKLKLKPLPKFHHFDKKCPNSPAASFAYNIVIDVNRLDHIDKIKNRISSR